MALYIVIQKIDKFLIKKNVKRRNWEHAFNASSYIVEISFNSELQLKVAEFTIKNELKNVCTALRVFKFEIVEKKQNMT